MKKIIEVYHNLNKSIYVGERLKANLSALTMVSIASALLGLVLIPINIATHQTTMLIAAVLTFLAASACGITAGVLKKRELAGLIPILFCTVAFTYYTVSGVGEGSAVLWSLLMPIGVSYFVSVKYGLLLSAYYSIFFGVIFYSPLQHRLGAYYSQSFMDRFPLLFLSISLFTGIAMVQYHRMALFEIEHTNRLNEEVARQTRVATERADQLERLSEEIVETLARTIDAKDRYTNGHSFRVSEYSVALAGTGALGAEARGPAPRHRQNRRSGRGAQQARQADRRGICDYQIPHHHRQDHSQWAGGDARCGGGGSLPP